MARRRPIAGHPAFAPLISLWFAALLGLTMAVLPASLIERALAAAGLHALVPLTVSLRAIASVLAAVIGALAGYGLAKALARRSEAGPRPLYDSEPRHEDVIPEARARRPLRVREELSDDFGYDVAAARVEGAEAQPIEPQGVAPWIGTGQSQAQEGFMILTPQPTHPPHPAPDLEALLEQFDAAVASFGADRSEGSEVGEASRSDPVQAFVARQTGVQAQAPASPLGGLVPDHQAELRAALDKLARSQRGE